GGSPRTVHTVAAAARRLWKILCPSMPEPPSTTMSGRMTTLLLAGPSDIFGQPFVKTYRGLITECRAGRRNVRQAVAHVSGARRRVLAPWLHLGGRRQLSHQIVDRDPQAAADVERSAHTRLRGRPDVRLHHVAHIDEIARLPAIAEDGQPLAAEH